MESLFTCSKLSDPLWPFWANSCVSQDPDLKSTLPHLPRGWLVSAVVPQPPEYHWPRSMIIYLFVYPYYSTQSFSRAGLCLSQTVFQKFTFSMYLVLVPDLPSWPPEPWRLSSGMFCCVFHLFYGHVLFSLLSFEKGKLMFNSYPYFPIFPIPILPHLQCETNVSYIKLASLSLSGHTIWPTGSGLFAQQRNSWLNASFVALPQVTCEFLLTPFKLFTRAFAIKSPARKRLMWHLKKCWRKTKWYKMIRYGDNIKKYMNHIKSTCWDTNRNTFKF